MKVCGTCGLELGDEADFCPEDGSPLEVRGRKTRDALVGTVVDRRYRISSKLGEGGMSVVYLAQHATLQRTVALKVLHPRLARVDKAVKRFAREARAASLIEHDNVVSVLDFGYAPEGFYYLAMEHVAGVPLDVEIGRSAPLPVARATHLIAQIVAGVSAAHEAGVVHRDLKPENVMLTTYRGDSDFVKVVDFGISKPLFDETPSTLSNVGDIFGTPHYMAPEQWRGKEADPRSDIYAVGVLAYELLAGRLPFMSDSPLVLMHAHLEEQPPPLRQVAPEVPPVLEAAVMTCMNKSSDERFESADALLEQLGAVWETVAAPTMRTSYGATAAAPPPRTKKDGIPDPTIYQPTEIDVVWDGPILAAEIGRLKAIRQRRLADLSEALWRGQLPPEVHDLRRSIDELEQHAETEGQEIALLEAKLGETDDQARRQSARARADVVGVNLNRASRQLSTDDEVFGDETTIPQTDLRNLDPRRQLRRAERRLAAVEQARLRERLDLEAQLSQHMIRLRTLESELVPKYEELWKHVQSAARNRPEVRPLLVAYGEIDGAIASYEALLEALED